MIAKQLIHPHIFTEQANETMASGFWIKARCQKQLFYHKAYFNFPFLLILPPETNPQNA